MIDQSAVRWRVDYRRVNEPTSRVHHEVVVAGSTDEARQEVRKIDPYFHSTIRSPRKLVTR